jgi:hypothetical protein
MLCHYGFPKLVHSVRLERLGEGLTVRSGETVVAHWVDEPMAQASTSGSSCATPEGSVVAYGMEDVVHAVRIL